MKNMIISKRDGKLDLTMLISHMNEIHDGSYVVSITHIDSPTKKQLAYFYSHIVPIYVRYLESCGIFLNKNVAANYLKEAMGFGEPKIDFDMDLGLTQREWQDLIERSFHKLLELGCNPVHPKDRNNK